MKKLILTASTLVTISTSANASELKIVNPFDVRIEKSSGHKTQETGINLIIANKTFQTCKNRSLQSIKIKIQNLNQIVSLSENKTKMLALDMNGPCVKAFYSDLSIYSVR